MTKINYVNKYCMCKTILKNYKKIKKYILLFWK